MTRAIRITRASEELAANTNNFLSLTLGYILLENNTETERFRPKWANTLYKLNAPLDTLKNEQLNPSQLTLIEKYLKTSQKAAQEIIYHHDLHLAWEREQEHEQEQLNAAIVKDAQERIEAATEILVNEADMVLGQALERSRQAETFSMIMLAFITLFAMFLAVLLSNSISKPIRKLTELTEQVDQGKLDIKLPQLSNDEIGTLAQSFNKMVVDLKKSRDDLTEHADELEAKVEERTRSLQEEMRKLENSKSATLNIMEDLSESLAKQKQLEKIKTEFLSVTSHELRTPITPMKAQLQMALGEYFGKLTDAQKKCLDMVLRNTVRLDHLIGDILDISKLESGNMKFIMAKADLNETVANVVETMQLKADEKKIKIRLRQDKIPQVAFDRDRITQVVTNLLNNAIKFTNIGANTGGSITVDVVDQGKEALIKVSDNGIGISKEDQERLFQPFVQIDSSMSRNAEGTGLGLAICKGIVQNHGGRIWIESEIGKGSTFLFTMPYKTKAGTGPTEMKLFR